MTCKKKEKKSKKYKKKFKKKKYKKKVKMGSSLPRPRRDPGDTESEQDTET